MLKEKLKQDEEIKDLLYSSAPDKNYQTKDYYIKLSDRYYKLINIFFYKIKKQITNKKLLDKLNQKEEELKTKLNNEQIENIPNYYKNHISQIRKEYQKALKQTIYPGHIDINIIDKSTSLNEILHTMHKILLNDINTYKENIIKQKQNTYLSGEENKIAEEIYNNINTKDEIYITSINKQIYIIINTITLEIRFLKDKAIINYHDKELEDIQIIDKKDLSTVINNYIKHKTLIHKN